MNAGWEGKVAVGIIAWAGVAGIGNSTPWSLVASAAAAEAAPCKLNMASGVNRCRIDVKVDDYGSKSCVMSIPDSEQRELVLNGQSNLRVVWRINGGAANGYQFCRYTGDGVFLKSPLLQTHGQVANMRVMKDPDDDSSEDGADFDCGARYKWKFVNKIGGPAPAGTKYEYLIRLRNADSTRTCEFDPFIKNG